MADDLRATQQAFDRIARGVQDGARDELKRIATKIRNEARPRIPNTTGRSSGRLSASLQVAATPKGAAIRSELDYARIIEYAWPRSTRGARMVTRSVEANDAMIERQIAHMVDRIARRNGFH